MTQQDSADVVREAQALLAGMRTVQLATLGINDEPLASYAPFVQFDGALYVYLSRLAAHARNVRNMPLLSAMLLRDESDCVDVFARPRLILQCSVVEHARDSEIFDRVLDRFVACFGDTARTLRELRDFSLFALHPRSARLVSGFARAVRFDEAAMHALFGAANGAAPAVRGPSAVVRGATPGNGNE